ncbi:DUF1636 family protein [Acidomonas methanolica]|uniref:Metal-binding protein n=1 Tax=Acidomonas methanolica NBRC 104435 TaxID=1231351 RepID=A0A023D9W6_ACIMT|nr:DUF1636 domain-containing protein [Acidomonas methanolica]MBU2655566.1 DUF1636 domain-containing protein [Acidomonas methanolica]GAJ30616.1 hypothetical protein Amme_210_007 [Acidomonas methanolica NBRC 104435]GBQ45777.1 hypothetical protein AA0498_0138 [Acidomonas methanolica]GEL00367.1 metal-binding protein [Acidomonas methanolica NBRC 104435]
MSNPVAATAPIVLTVCVTCRRGLSPSELGEAPLPGRLLYEALQTRLSEGEVLLRPVECMSSCNRGCMAAASMPGKWTFLLAGMGPEKADDLVEWVKLYSASKTGMVPVSKRPASLADMVIARLPGAMANTEKPL